MIPMKLFSLILLISAVASGTDFNSDQLKRFVERYVKSTFTDSTTDVTVEFRNVPSDITLPSDGFSFRVVDADGKAYKGNVSLPIEIVYRGTVYRKFFVSVKVRTFENVLVANTLIDRAESNIEDKITSKKIETTSFSQKPLKNKIQLEGKQTRRIINEESVLYENWFEEMAVIKQNSVLNLVVNSNGVKVSTHVVAKEDGRLNDMIAVEEVASRKRHKATVVNNRTVEIRLD